MQTKSKGMVIFNVLTCIILGILWLCVQKWWVGAGFLALALGTAGFYLWKQRREGAAVSHDKSDEVSTALHV